MDPLGVWGMDPNLLNVFVAVVFVNAPTVFRIVRGIVLDIRSRDYVAAGQTRGEGPWYIMLWEMLPNARGPLIVDFCLRIGYTTILLGTLGFFGLGVSPESPDWGSTINDGRRLLSIYPHPAVVPAVALMSLVLGLNLLADGLREESPEGLRMSQTKPVSIRSRTTTSGTPRSQRMMGMICFLSIWRRNAAATHLGSTMPAPRPALARATSRIRRGTHTESIRSPYAFQTPCLEGRT
jgi:hypothetical protein